MSRGKREDKKYKLRRINNKLRGIEEDDLEQDNKNKSAVLSQYITVHLLSRSISILLLMILFIAIKEIAYQYIKILWVFVCEILPSVLVVNVIELSLKTIILKYSTT